MMVVGESGSGPRGATFREDERIADFVGFICCFC